MKKMIALIKVGFKSTSLFSALKLRMKMNKRERLLIPLAAVAILLGVLPLYYFFMEMIGQFYQLLAPLNQTQAILTLVILAGQVFILVFGIYYMMSVFYFSRDLETLIPLPLKPHQVMFSKYAVILINEYIGLAAVILPVLVYYGIISGAGIGYWIRLPIVYLTLPVIPLAISALLVILLMRFVNLGKKKDTLIILGSVLLIGLFLALQLSIRGSQQGVSQSQVIHFLTAENGMVQQLSSSFPPAGWATRALAEGFSPGGFPGLVSLVGISLLFMAALLFVGEKLFYRGLIGIREVGVNHKKISAHKISGKISTGSHPVLAIFSREFKLMNRTPMFLLNGIFTVVLIPGVFLLMLLTGKGESAQMLTKLIKTGNSVYIMLAAAGFCVFSGTLNGTASSTFSREGTRFWISRVIPVPYKYQVLGKMLHSLVVALLGTVIASLVVIIFFKLNILEMLVVLILSVTAGVALISIGMAIDLSRPLLDWISPQRAIKQNINVFLSMIIQIALLVGLGYLSSVLVKMGWNPTLLLVAIFLLLLLLAVAGVSYLLNSAPKKYEKVMV